MSHAPQQHRARLKRDMEYTKGATKSQKAHTTCDTTVLRRMPQERGLASREQTPSAKQNSRPIRSAPPNLVNQSLVGVVCLLSLLEVLLLFIVSPGRRLQPTYAIQHNAFREGRQRNVLDNWEVPDGDFFLETCKHRVQNLPVDAPANLESESA